jgi:hypothetical protein
LSIHESESGSVSAGEKDDFERRQKGGEADGSIDGDSFKKRMEKLRDENSTNLYIEGLPLSIDDAVRNFLAYLPRLLIFMMRRH